MKQDHDKIKSNKIIFNDCIYVTSFSSILCLVPRPGQSTWLEELMNGLCSELRYYFAGLKLVLFGNSVPKTASSQKGLETCFPFEYLLPNHPINGRTPDQSTGPYLI